MRLGLLLSALVPAVFADCSSQAYNTVSGFSGSGGCVPGGYIGTMDLGNTNPADVTSRCMARCAEVSNCEAYVGQLFKAADSNAYTGQCFLYTSIPTDPRVCVDHPTDLVVGAKDHSSECLAAAPVAADFCSSYLSLPVATVYTSTVTPVSTVFTTSETTRTTTKKSTTVTETTSTKTISKTTKVTPYTNTKTSVTLTTTTTISTQAGAVNTVTVQKRTSDAGAIATPTCLATAPASQISSACSCLNVATSTVSLISTAPTSTTTVILKTKTTVETSFTTTTRVSTLKETTTSFSTSIITKPVTETTTTTSIITTSSTTTAAASVNTVICNRRGTPGSNSIINAQIANDVQGCLRMCKTFPKGSPQYCQSIYWRPVQPGTLNNNCWALYSDASGASFTADPNGVYLLADLGCSS